MHYLTEKQIAGISTKLHEQKINYSHLFDDLLDHVCCDIETYMQKGLNYKQASDKTFEKIGLNGLREIQEATIFYVKLNLVIMKKLMNVLAIIGTAILTSGLVFKINHWAGGSLLFFFGILLLFLGFFPAALLNIRKEYKLDFFSMQFAIYLVGFVTILVTGAALLFTTMHWPYGKFLVLSSMALMLLVFFPMLLYRAIKSNQNRTVNISLVIFSFLFIAIIDVQTYNSQTSVYSVIDNAILEKEISFYKKAVKNQVFNTSAPKNKELEELDQSLSEIEKLVTGYQKIILNKKDNIYQFSISFLHGSGMNPEYDEGFKTLQNLIRKYQAEALNMSAGNQILQLLITEKLNTEDYVVDVYGTISWVKRNFEGYGGEKRIYTSLNVILRDLYQVYYEVLRNQEFKEAPEL